MIVFNRVRVNGSASGEIIMDQADKIEALTKPTNDKDFASRRADAEYIGVNCRPDICAPVQLTAPGRQRTTKDEYKTLWKVIDQLKATKNIGLRFVPL